MFAFNPKRVLLCIAVFIVYGSLYPFDFALLERNPHDLNALFHIELTSPRWGDILSNLILFSPYGFIGMALAGTERQWVRKFAVLTLSGGVLAFVLQWAQVYLPTRFPSLLDTLCNVLGILLGGLSFLLIQAPTYPDRLKFSPIELIAYGLIAFWVLEHLGCLLPDFDLLRLSRRIPFLTPHASVSPAHVATTAISWMLFIHLWEFIKKKPTSIIWQMKVATMLFLLKIMVGSNAFQWEDAWGAGIGLLVWNLSIRELGRRKEVLVGLLLVVLAWRGFSPFIWRETPLPFHWLPFAISILGEPMFQISVLVQKCFLYGCLAWLLVEGRTTPPWDWMLSGGFLLGLECAQRYTAGQIPDITDPLLGWLLMIIIKNAFNEQGSWLSSKPARPTTTLKVLPSGPSPHPPV